MNFSSKTYLQNYLAPWWQLVTTLPTGIPCLIDAIALCVRVRVVCVCVCTCFSVCVCGGCLPKNRSLFDKAVSLA